MCAVQVGHCNVCEQASDLFRAAPVAMALLELVSVQAVLVRVGQVAHKAGRHVVDSGTLLISHDVQLLLIASWCCARLRAVLERGPDVRQMN